ncbi:MAG: Nif3-like dinuclear metal center hexameric protein [Phycisphaerae bacterium]|nr:Nif3-like dinuclear metal center hexameric protein [Phycisphaerae bacterium]
MKLEKLLVKLNEIAPLELAEEWDNVGLLAGDTASDIKNIMLTIDLTREVLDVARAKKVDLIIAYHPPIFEPVKKVVAGQGPSPLLFEAIRSNIAIYSFHTALDVAPGGVNDALADMLGLKNTTPLAPGEYETGKYCKIVCFVPEDDIAPVSQAVFAAGAGSADPDSHYSQCSFKAAGTGSFYCGPDSSPTIGKADSFTETAEYKFETIVPTNLLKKVVNAMSKAHSYQEPAYDIIPLLKGNDSGLGRIGLLEKPIAIPTLIEHIKKSLKIKSVGIIGPAKGKVQKGAACAGSCGTLLRNVIKQNCDFYLTGELKHHHALELQAAGITTICVSHSNSERLILAKLAAQLRKFDNKLTVNLCSKDKDPFIWC